MKKQTKSKKAGSSRKTEKPAVAKAPRTKSRDPRLPAAGATLTRTYKGKQLKVAVLEDGFRFEGEEFRSLSALAMKITGYAAINGVAWFGLTKRAEPSKPESAKETPAPAKKRAPKNRRVGREPQRETPTTSVPAAETIAAA